MRKWCVAVVVVGSVIGCSGFRDAFTARVDAVARAGGRELTVNRLADILAPGGVALVTTFLASDGYKPDEMARQASQILWSTVFTRSELSFITEELPFDRISDESMHDYEKDHLPSDAWPPTTWYEGWALGSDVFSLPLGKAPMELRWVAHRRR